MTIDTIRDVLGRIIAINKNLTEESLKNLLIASGWDDADVSQGLKIFRDYYGSGPTVSMQPRPADMVTPEPAPQPILSQVPIVESSPEPFPVPEPQPIPTPTPVPQPAPQKFSVFEINRSQDVSSAIPSSAPEAVPQPTSVFDMPRPTLQMEPKPEPQKVVPPVVAPVASPAADVHEEYVEKHHFPTPWGILIVDIVLFLIALGLLVYIITR